MQASAVSLATKPAEIAPAASAVPADPPAPSVAVVPVGDAPASVRITPDQRSRLKRYARQKDASVGELLRLALEAMPPKGKKKK